VGLIAHANRGTLFLDEVDSLSPKGQTAILRVLQDKRFRAVGANEEQESDVRIVAATNACLESRIKSGEFRADLFYRLGILTIHLPALRDRHGDVLLLANHFLQKHAPANRTICFSNAACERLSNWHWPGNLRELENAVIRACAMCEEGEISVAVLGLPEILEQTDSAGATGGSSAMEFAIAKRRMIKAFERDYLTRLMKDHCGNISQAAQAAGKERRDLGKLLKKHHLDPIGFRSQMNPVLAG
jgi:DNA-binding NtrC family response regulator